MIKITFMVTNTSLKVQITLTSWGTERLISHFEVTYRNFEICILKEDC